MIYWTNVLHNCDVTCSSSEGSIAGYVFGAIIVIVVIVVVIIIIKKKHIGRAGRVHDVQTATTVTTVHAPQPQPGHHHLSPLLSIILNSHQLPFNLMKDFKLS